MGKGWLDAPLIKKRFRKEQKNQARTARESLKASWRRSPWLEALEFFNAETAFSTETYIIYIRHYYNIVLFYRGQATPSSAKALKNKS